jgi:hypothetical protein
MTLINLITQLQEIEREHGGALEVFSIHGASGASAELSTPFFCGDAKEQGCDAGPLGEYPEGKPFVWIYEGN